MNIKLSKYKFLEFGLMRGSGVWSDYFRLIICWSRCCDHAGFIVSLDIMNFSPYFEIRDIRHWDDENNRWCVYEEKEK